MDLGYKVTIIGTNTNYDTATVAYSTLNVEDNVVQTFDLTFINMRNESDIETVTALSGKLVETKKVVRNTFDLRLRYKNFKVQTSTATYEANRFFDNLLIDKKYHFIFFHNASNEVFNYPYLPKALNSTTIETDALQVLFNAPVNVSQINNSNLYEFSLSFITTYPIN